MSLESDQPWEFHQIPGSQYLKPKQFNFSSPKCVCGKFTAFLIHNVYYCCM